MGFRKLDVWKAESGRKNAEGEKSRSRIIWVSVTRSLGGGMLKVENRETTLGNVTVLLREIWKIDGLENNCIRSRVRKKMVESGNFEMTC